MKLSRRAVLGGAVAAALPVWGSAVAADAELSADVAQMLMMGFTGSRIFSSSARHLARHAAAGRVGTIFFVRNNVGSLPHLASLLDLLKRDAPSDLQFAIDHEGGAVQRLGTEHGCDIVPRAREVAASLSPDEAKDLYARAGRQISEVGFTINLAPVVDLDDPQNPAIGRYGRAFSSDPDKVVIYARAFIDGFATAGVTCALKHFPGHGRSGTDSHNGLPDITTSWGPDELKPFARLIDTGHADLVLGGHLRLASVEAAPIPTTLSSAVTTGILRDSLRFKGVIMTDDIDMVAVAREMDRRDAFIQAIKAGNDLIMVRNDRSHDSDLPIRVVEWVGDAIAAGSLSRSQIRDSAQRVRDMKKKRSVRKTSAE